MKKALSFALALAMCLGLTVPAFAESVTVVSPDMATLEISEAAQAGSITYDGGDGETYTNDLYEVPVGVKVSDRLGMLQVFIYEITQKPDGTFLFGSSANAPEFSGSATFGPGFEGYWLVRYGLAEFGNVVIHVGGAPSVSEPEQPTAPVQPEQPTEPERTGDRFTTDKPSTGTVTVDINGKQETVRLYPVGTVFTWKGPSFNSGFSMVSILGKETLGAYFDSFTLKDDGIYYISVEDIVVYAKADTSAPPAYQVSDWAKDRVAQAVETGLAADGLGNDYRVNITRAQFAATAVKLYEAMSGANAPAASANIFTDTTDPAVLQAAELGFVSGMGDGKFAPDALVTREQAAVMLSAVYIKLGGAVPAVETTSFADNASISAWAQNAVAFMNSKAIVSGMGNNSFNPQGNASIEQALIIALNMFEILK